jgi:hypothetical protein
MNVEVACHGFSIFVRFIYTFKLDAVSIADGPHLSLPAKLRRNLPVQLGPKSSGTLSHLFFLPLCQFSRLISSQVQGSKPSVPKTTSLMSISSQN